MTTTTTTTLKIRRTNGDGLYDNERLSSDLSFAKKSDWILWEEFSYPTNATIRLTDGDGVNDSMCASVDEALEYINAPNGTLRPITTAHVYTIDMEGRVRRLKLGYINQFDRWNAD